MSLRMSVKGDEGLFRDLETLYDAVPEYEKLMLETVSEKFKEDLRQKVRSNVRTDRKLTKGFYTEVRSGSLSFDKYAVFYAEDGKINPHWHLIEHGHDIVRPKKGRNGHPTKDPGAILGHVEGLKQMKVMESEYAAIMEDAAYDVINKAAEEGNL